MLTDYSKTKYFILHGFVDKFVCFAGELQRGHRWSATISWNAFVAIKWHFYRGGGPQAVAGSKWSKFSIQFLFLDRGDDVQVLGVQEAVLYSKATLQSLQMARCRVLRHLRFAITSQHQLICTIWTQITSPLGLLFQIKCQDNYQDKSFVLKKVILVVQYSDEIQDIQDIYIHIQDHIQDSPISKMRWRGRQTSSGSSGGSFWKSERLFTFLNCLLQPLTLFWIEVIHLNIKHAIYRFLEAINQLLSTLEQWCQSDVKQQLLTILHGRRAAPDWLTSMAASTTMAASYWPTLLLTLLSPALLLLNN